MRRMLGLEQGMRRRRRSSIMIDMDLFTAPPTRRPSPEPEEGRPSATLINETINEEGDLIARKAGLGNLMKTARQDVQVPEFNMDSFS
jgi:hypothetical protein